MKKNVVIFSDGTGQGSSMPDDELTNVCKLWNATKDVDHARQITSYDAGLGAPDPDWWRWGYNKMSQATGLGISRNIKDCYRALVEFYNPGDDIFLFGFSRGAYTVRSVGGVLSLCGIPTRGADGRDPRTNAAAREALVEEAVEKVYKHYGNDEKTKAERHTLGAKYRETYASDPAIPYFIGVWDTVRALGIPGSSGLVLWRHAFHDASLNRKVAYARQALSIDENRKTFAPELWDESEETPEDKARGRIKQVWFPGVHSDVGGGYPDTGLSDLALEWMVQEATAVERALLIDRTKLRLNPSFKGRQHDERTGWGNLWAEGTREACTPNSLKEADVGHRFAEAGVPYLDGDRPYRPQALAKHETYRRYYNK